MPPHKSVASLRKSCMIALARHWDLICYGVHSCQEMAELLESDGYLAYDGPFTDFPSTILEDLMDVIRATRNLTRKFLHLLLREQLLKLNLSFGIGEVYYGLQFLPRCKRLRELNMCYLRHVEPSHIKPIIPCLNFVVNLNLGNSSANDTMLRKISECCSNLTELNLQGTYVSDEGMQSLCGDGESCGVSGTSGCLKLQRLIVSETRVTWVGAYTVIYGLPLLTDFDFDKIFQVFEHLDPRSLLVEAESGRHRKLHLRSLYSTTPSIRGESIDTAAVLCPNAEILSVMNSWIDNETFYKFMQFEHLKTLTIFNSEGKTLDFEDGIQIVLQIVGPTLENLILSKFVSVDLISVGKSCPRLRKIALSGIQELKINTHGPEEGIFTMLTNLELWLDGDTHSASFPILIQLLQNAVLLENLLVKKSAFDLDLLRTIWMSNPMRHLSRIMIDECPVVNGEAISELLRMDNDLTTIRIWSCPHITLEDKRSLQNFIIQNNLYVYLEWFE